MTLVLIQSSKKGSQPERDDTPGFNLDRSWLVCQVLFKSYDAGRGKNKKKGTEDVPVCLFLEENQTFRSGLLRRAAENERRKYILSPKGRKGRREFLSCLHLLSSICPAGEKKNKKRLYLQIFHFT